MAEAFKNMFNYKFLEKFSNDLSLVVSNFDTEKFIVEIMDHDWPNKEYKQRIKHISSVLYGFLPADYDKAIDKLLLLIERIRDRFADFSVIDDKNFQLLTLEYGSILDSYVEQYGLNYLDTSIRAIETFTQFTSCEFCVRPFIVKYPQEMMQQMLLWSSHSHWAVRRLASEGCRPRLPWGMAISHLKNNPLPILPILENLKNDPARFVRLSVANNLNDISKDNPEFVISIANKWYGENENINWILKHGCRTLLKNGNAQVMALFGFEKAGESIKIEHFNLLTPKVKVGDFLEFNFNLLNLDKDDRKIRLEYAIYYKKANGQLTKKVHKISEKKYNGLTQSNISRKHSFRLVTTRKFYCGIHQVAIIINGQEFEKNNFELIN